MAKWSWIFLSALMLWSVAGAHGDYMASRSRLTSDLLRGNGPLSNAPIARKDEPVTVRLRASLIDLVAVEPEKFQLDLVLWLTMEWTDFRLRWNPADYNVTKLHVDPKYIWRPDIVVYNQKAPAEMMYPDIQAILYPTGKVNYVPGIRYRINCDLSGLAGQGANCPLKFGSWTYDGSEVDLQFYSPDVTDMEMYDLLPGNPEYVVTGAPAERHVVHYACCPEPYVDIQYNITIRTPRQSSVFGWF